MSEYWVSTAKRYCDACKCYIGDNKASIQNHEQGKRHKENVAKRVEAIAKRGAEDYAKRTAYEKQMAKIEAAALAAVTKDGVSMGEQDRKQCEEIMKRATEEAQTSYYESTTAEVDVGSERSRPVLPAKIKTPDETKGIASGWVTVAVKDILPKYEQEDEASTKIEEIPLPPQEKRKRFGEKIVTLSAFDDGDKNTQNADGASTKVEFALKRKVNRANMRQRTSDE